MASKKKQPESLFPTHVYVSHEYDADEPYLLAHDNVEDHADLNGETRVGIYRLEKVVTVKVKIEAT